MAVDTPRPELDGSGLLVCALWPVERNAEALAEWQNESRFEKAAWVAAARVLRHTVIGHTGTPTR